METSKEELSLQMCFAYVSLFVHSFVIEPILNCQRKVVQRKWETDTNRRFQTSRRPEAFNELS